MTRTASVQITKSESNIEYCRDQKAAQGSGEQNSTANRTNDRDKIFHESLSKNRQYLCKVKKQEVEQQEHRTVQNQKEHQGVKLQARLTQENADTPDISCVNASVLQSVHTTSNH